MRTADQIRSAFLDYFESRGHRVVRSSSLVPESDPTLLFANAGMNQFKDTFLGREHREYRRAASSQKCVRAGGKHNDLENVGRTARHHTFFEMLGNFSFGDYFKQDAIAFAWELLTRELALPQQRLKVTIFKGEDGVPRDAEAHGFWRAHVKPERILELGAKDNFWAMGETGPCGPCSEIHFFQGDEIPCAEAAAGRPCLGVECECDRWLEVWNLVFMQYDRNAQGQLAPLPAPCIDTGMGLERVTAVVQGRKSNYDTDLFTPLIEAVARRAGKTYGAQADDDVSLRVIADHLRATTFLIADGVIPGNEGRGYVLRKIMRRALRHGKRLGLEQPFLAELSAHVVERMAPAYPELLTHRAAVERVASIEADRFQDTLRGALSVFEEVAVRATQAGNRISGADAFLLYDTYGMALDFVEELAEERRLGVDRAGFDAELEGQRRRAREASKLGALTGDPVYLGLLDKGKTQFLGYDHLSVDEARVLAVLEGGKLVPRVELGDQAEVVLDRTPFYGMAGGQVGDVGTLEAEGASAEVLDCTLPVPGLYVHRVRVIAGAFEPGQLVHAQVDADHRAATRRHHTATHLLHAALRETLGTHVKQAGSLVTPERLRFDFSHYAPVSPRELRHIERRVHGEVLRDTPVETRVMKRDDALSQGALAFFGDKYGEQVRVVQVEGFSKEFCGGTHVTRTGEIGLLLVTNEQGISAGTRRIEALVGEAALQRAQQDDGLLAQLEQGAKSDRTGLVDEYARLREQLRTAQREVDRLKHKLATASATGDNNQDLAEVAGVKLWTPRFEGLDRKGHAAVVDEFRNRHRDERFALVSCAVADDGVSVVAAVSSSMTERIKAPEVMKRLGLRGGGRPDFAQGGGVVADDVDALRTRAGELLRSLLGGTSA